MKNKKVIHVIAATLLTATLGTVTYYSNLNNEEASKKDSSVENLNLTDQVSTYSRETPEMKFTEKETDQDTKADGKVNTEEKQTEQVEQVETKTVTMYSTGSLNLRKGVGVEAEIYTTVPVNTELQMVDNFLIDGWRKILYDNQELYVNGKYLSESKIEVPPEPVIENTSINTSFANTQRGKYLGTFKITHYGEGVITATGTTPTVGRTIAVDPSVIPYGSKVIINGHTYIAEDCGGAVKGNVIDIFVENNAKAIQLGVYYAEVYLG